MKMYIYSLHCRCDGCQMNPIEGPRFHCQVCADFDFCKECFLHGQSHDHAFERIDDQGQAAVYVGSPKSCRLAIKQRKKVNIKYKDLILEVGHTINTRILL